MGKIVIVQEKADKLIDKLECIKDCVTEVIECINASKHNTEDDEQWDDEYAIKRRRGNRPGYMYPNNMRPVEGRPYDDDEDEDEYRRRTKYNRTRY